MINHTLYSDLNNKENLFRYCEYVDSINLKKVNHSKIKNYVMNYLYMIEELTSAEKYLFCFLYDFKSQQKFLPWLEIKYSKIAYMLWISKSTISKIFKKLFEYNIIIEWLNIFNEKILIINEDITTWWIAINEERLSYLEESRKHFASSNVQLSEEYKIYSKVKWNN